MIDFSDPAEAHLRLSDTEREQAIALLGENHRQGRITQQEFSERSAICRTALTRGDVATVFDDLPTDARAQSTGFGDGSAAAPAPGGAGADAYPAVADPYLAGRNPHPADPDAYPARASGFPDPVPQRGALGGRTGLIIVSIAPFVALVLFFLTGAFGGWDYAWLWFILIPLTGGIVYGVGSGRDRGRR